MDVSKTLLDVDDFECSLCYRLLHEPVTTPCGHSFCRPCLDRCLDHQSNCPLCKGSLVEVGLSLYFKIQCIFLVLISFYRFLLRSFLLECLLDIIVCFQVLIFIFILQYLAERRQTRDESLENIIKTYFPEEYEGRKKLHEDEMAELAK